MHALGIVSLGRLGTTESLVLQFFPGRAGSPIWKMPSEPPRWSLDTARPLRPANSPGAQDPMSW